MGSDLRERESGGTGRGTAPEPPTRGGGTASPWTAPSAGPRRRERATGGTRGRPHGGPTGGRGAGETGRRGKRRGGASGYGGAEEAPVRGGPWGTWPRRTGAFS